MLTVDGPKFQRLFECEDMFRPIVTCQRFGNRFLATLAQRITKLSQGNRVTLASDNSPNDCHACLSRDVTDNIVQLDVHQMECLLHVLDMGTPIADQVLTLSDISPQGNKVCWGTK